MVPVPSALPPTSAEVNPHICRLIFLPLKSYPDLGNTNCWNLFPWKLVPWTTNSPETASSVQLASHKWAANKVKWKTTQCLLWLSASLQVHPALTPAQAILGTVCLRGGRGVVRWTPVHWWALSGKPTWPAQSEMALEVGCTRAELSRERERIILVIGWGRQPVSPHVHKSHVLRFLPIYVKASSSFKTSTRCLGASWLEQEDREGDTLSSFSTSRSELGLVLTTVFPAAQSSLQEDLCLGVNADTQPFLKNPSWEV